MRVARSQGKVNRDKKLLLNRHSKSSSLILNQYFGSNISPSSPAPARADGSHFTANGCAQRWDIRGAPREKTTSTEKQNKTFKANITTDLTKKREKAVFFHTGAAYWMRGHCEFLFHMKFTPGTSRCLQSCHFWSASSSQSWVLPNKNQSAPTASQPGQWIQVVPQKAGLGGCSLGKLLTRRSGTGRTAPTITCFSSS